MITKGTRAALRLMAESTVGRVLPVDQEHLVALLDQLDAAEAHIYPPGEPECVRCGAFGPNEGDTPCQPNKSAAVHLLYERDHIRGEYDVACAERDHLRAELERVTPIAVWCARTASERDLARNEAEATKGALLESKKALELAYCSNRCDWQCYCGRRSALEMIAALSPAKETK